MITIYFYCAKSKPYLTDPRKGYVSLYGERGFVVARCTAEKAVKIPPSLILARKDDREEMISSSICSDIGLDRAGHSCVQWKDIYDYSKGKDVYALYLRDVSLCEFHLCEFSHDRKGLKRIHRAPQSWCHAYHDGEECYVFSDYQEYCEHIVNKKKTIELRKTLPKKGIEICR
jgi:hypothetical protein